MTPNAEFLLLFSNLQENDYGEDADELLAVMVKIVAMTTSEAVDLALAASKYHLNQNDTWGDDAGEAAASFAKLIVQHGHEYKSKYGDGFDVSALVKTIAGMMTSKMDRIEQRKLMNILHIDTERYKTLYGTAYAVMPIDWN